MALSVVQSERFLIDKSAAARILRPAVRPSWLDVLRNGHVSVCEVTEFEMLYSARSAQEYKQIQEQLRGLYAWVPVPGDGWAQVLRVQEALTDLGRHRSVGAPDLFIAVTARAHRMTVLHYDRDFENIAGVIDVRTRWLAEPGSID
ncbi:PIN domain nuclease [Streptomyces sp. NPDC002054]|uniref:PIN domain nuclease n=1 Tax=Streptomyces sp. NPDC002054 TaxID=3154663 RepID=UPI003333A48C